MKSDQLIEYNKANFSFKNHAENEPGRLVPDLLFLKRKKVHLRYKQVVCSLVLVYLTITLNLAYTKNKVYKYLD